MANAHRKQNLIRKLKINSVWSTDQRSLRQDIVNAFQSILSYPENWKSSIKGLSFSIISEREALNLELPFSEEEVFSTLYGGWG